MKDRLDRHQEHLREEERRRLLAQARQIMARSRSRSARDSAAPDAGFRRWAISFGIAVTLIVTATVVLIVRNHEERQEASSLQRPLEIIGQIPARPAPPKTASRDLLASGGVTFRQDATDPFVDPVTDSISFFTVHVGDESYRVARAAIAAGRLPPPEEVRTEEFVNSFRQGYPEFADADLRLFADGAPAPFGDGTILLRVGIKARRAGGGSSDTVVARNVSAAVTFDAHCVKSYRLLGFRERKGVPSGRDIVAAGYEVVALYEIQPVKGAPPARIATLRVRYRQADGRERREIDRPILSSDLGSVFALAPARFRLDAAAARFADILRAPASPGRAEALADLIPMVEELAGELGADRKVGELADLVKKAAILSRPPG